jgi:glycosyltransferase involved in cell wall biosynthesis
MNCLFVTSTYPLQAGDAIPSFVADLAKALVNEQGVRVRVVAPHHPGAPKREIVDGVHIERFQYALNPSAQCLAYGSGIPDNLRQSLRAKWQLPAFLAAMAMAIRRNLDGVDLIHAHWVEPAFIASLANCLHRKPLVVTVHSLNPRANWLARHTLRQANRVLFNSQYTMSRAAAMKYRCHGQVVYQGYDAALFGARRRTGELRAALGIPPDARLVAAVGRMIELKGMHVLAEAAKRILHDRPDVHLVLAGDGPMRDEVRRIVSNEPRVHLPGALVRTAVAELLAEADVFVNPGIVDRHGRAEGLGITSIEAMASGVPVVGSRIGGIAETITDGITGKLVPPGDVGALAEAVGGMLDDPELRARMGRHGRDVAQRHFAWSVLAGQVRHVYRELLASQV